MGAIEQHPRSDGDGAELAAFELRPDGEARALPTYACPSEFLDRVAADMEGLKSSVIWRMGCYIQTIPARDGWAEISIKEQADALERPMMFGNGDRCAICAAGAWLLESCGLRNAHGLSETARGVYDVISLEQIIRSFGYDDPELGGILNMLRSIDRLRCTEINSSMDFLQQAVRYRAIGAAQSSDRRNSMLIGLESLIDSDSWHEQLWHRVMAELRLGAEPDATGAADVSSYWTIAAATEAYNQEDYGHVLAMLKGAAAFLRAEGL